MTSKENYADLNATKLFNKINDLTIGEDTSDQLTIASILNIPRGTTGDVLTKQENGTVDFAASTGGSGSGIVNNRIDGDLTIGEDNSELLTIASTITVPTPTADTHAATKIYVDNNINSAADGAIILDSKTIISDTQNVELDAGTNHANYEYFSVACIDVLGTLSGYIVWQPVDTSGSTHGTASNSKWESTNLTDEDNNLITQATKNYHILGYHTKGKQYIKVKIFSLNKADKKYSSFKSVGLHSTGIETISQEGNTSQSSTTICKEIRFNNYALDGTLGDIKTGTFILYGYKKTGILTSTLIPSPIASNTGQTLKVNSTGDEYEFADYGLTVQEEGSSLSTTATTLNFTGTSVTASGTGTTKIITISGGITNNRIDGDLTIGEDSSDVLTITSKLNIPGGTTGHVLTKQADGSVKLAAGGTVALSSIDTTGSSPGDVLTIIAGGYTAIAGAGAGAPDTPYHSDELSGSWLTTNAYDNIIAGSGYGWANTGPNSPFSSSGYEWIGYLFTNDKTVTTYRIWPRTSTSWGATSNPRTWTLRGAASKTAHDNGSFTTLHSVSLSGDNTIAAALVAWSEIGNYPGSNSNASDNLQLSKDYTIATPGAYKYYVLYITDNFGEPDDYIALGEWALYTGSLNDHVGWA